MAIKAVIVAFQLTSIEWMKYIEKLITVPQITGTIKNDAAEIDRRKMEQKTKTAKALKMQESGTHFAIALFQG